MERKQLEEAFCRKISRELEQFKEEALRMGKEEIFSIAYRIDCMVRIYEMLAEHSGELGGEELKQCIQEEGLLQSLYQGWLKSPVPQEEGLEHSVWSGIAKICKRSESELRAIRKNQKFSEPKEKSGMNPNPRENQREKEREANREKD